MGTSGVGGCDTEQTRASRLKTILQYHDSSMTVFDLFLGINLVDGSMQKFANMKCISIYLSYTYILYDP